MSFADDETPHVTLGICDLGRFDPFACGESVFDGITRANEHCSFVFFQNLSLEYIFARAKFVSLV